MNKCRFSTWIICNLRRIYVPGFDYVYLKLFPKSVKWIKVLHNSWKLSYIEICMQYYDHLQRSGSRRLNEGIELNNLNFQYFFNTL